MTGAAFSNAVPSAAMCAQIMCRFKLGDISAKNPAIVKVPTKRGMVPWRCRCVSSMTTNADSPCRVVRLAALVVGRH